MKGKYEEIIKLTASVIKMIKASNGMYILEKDRIV